MLMANNIEEQHSYDTLDLQNALFDGPLRFYYNSEYESGVVSIYNKVINTLGLELFRSFIQVDGRYSWLVKVYFTPLSDCSFDISINDSIYNIYYDFDKTSSENEKKCMICGKPSEKTICPRCQVYIEGEARDKKKQKDKKDRTDKDWVKPKGPPPK